MTFVQPVRYQDADLFGNALITDGPYGARTHKGHNEAHKQVTDATGQATRRAITYEPWTEENVRELIGWAKPRISGWMACFTSHDLVMPYMEAYESYGLYAFAPVSVIIPRPRLLGDGPASWTCYLCVARPRTREFMRWRCLPGMYRSSSERGVPVVGAKRVTLMEEIIRDYSNRGDTIVDPCTGGGSTGVAALRMGRDFQGAEMNPELAAFAEDRIHQESRLRGVLGQIPEPPVSSKDKSPFVEEEQDGL